MSTLSSHKAPLFTNSGALMFFEFQFDQLAANIALRLSIFTLVRRIGTILRIVRTPRSSEDVAILQQQEDLKPHVSGM